MRHPEFPVVSLLIIPPLLCSLPSHIRTGSVCMIALIGWMTILNLIHAINSIVWANNAVVRLEVWCDISTKILIGYTYAVPLSALCICRQLESVSSARQVMFTQSDKRRRMKFEAIMCLGVPLVFMALHYVVQGHRFDIIEDFGCYPATYVSVAGLLLVWIPPLAISLTTMIYAVAAIHHFLCRRIEFAAVLHRSHSAISPARYFRLMAFAIFEIVWDTSTNLYIIYFNINLTGLRPWISWANVHSNFSRVGTFPHFLIPPSLITQFSWQWWIIPISCLFFIIFFGFGNEAVGDYRKAIMRLRHSILRLLRIKPSALAELPIHSVDFTRHVTVTSDALSFHGSKAWDEVSFKTPESSERLRSTTDFRSPSLRDTRMELTQCQESDSFVDMPTPSEISSSTSTSLFHPHPPHLPAVTVTRPASDSVSLAIVPLDLDATTEIPAPCEDSSFANPHPNNYRKSVSTEFGITVSQAYLPTYETVSRYHNETLLTHCAPSAPEAAHTHPRGGILHTVI